MADEALRDRAIGDERRDALAEFLPPVGVFGLLKGGPYSGLFPANETDPWDAAFAGTAEAWIKAQKDSAATVALTRAREVAAE